MCELILNNFFLGDGEGTKVEGTTKQQKETNQNTHSPYSLLAGMRTKRALLAALANRRISHNLACSSSSRNSFSSVTSSSSSSSCFVAVNIFDFG